MSKGLDGVVGVTKRPGVPRHARLMVGTLPTARWYGAKAAALDAPPIGVDGSSCRICWACLCTWGFRSLSSSKFAVIEQFVVIPEVWFLRPPEAGELPTEVMCFSLLRYDVYRPGWMCVAGWISHLDSTR